MNNEPVAWAYIKDGEFWDAIHPDEHAQEEGSYTIPLYTHPVNTCKHGVDDGACKECYQEVTHSAGLTNEEIEEVWYALELDSNLFDFAKAILRKAQEK